MINLTETFDARPIFFRIDEGKAEVGFNESSRIFQINTGDKNFEGWSAKIKEAMKAEKTVKLTISQKGIIDIE